MKQKTQSFKNVAYNNNFNPLDFIENVNEICVLIMNRGVDPYTTKVPIKYGLGRLFGSNNFLLNLDHKKK